MEMACMFAKMLNAILFARQNTIYAVVYVLACFCEFVFFFCRLTELFYKHISVMIKSSDVQ